MGKAIVFVVFMVIGFVVATMATGDLQQAVVEKTNDAAFQADRCIRQVEKVAPRPERAEEICGCMNAEFDNRGLKLFDAMGDDFDEMQAITKSCVTLYS